MTDQQILAFLNMLDEYALSKDRYCGLPIGWSAEIDAYMVQMVRGYFSIGGPKE